MKGSEAYRIVAQEIDDPSITVDDLRPEIVKAAKEYAKKGHKKWPPKPVSDMPMVYFFTVGGNRTVAKEIK